MEKSFDEWYFFEPFKNLSLPTAQIKLDAVSVPTGYKLIVTSDKLAKAVYLSSKTAGFFLTTTSI